MPTIPEAAIAMLACARIGAVHSVVFGGFSAESIRDRIADCGATAVITADGGYRRGAIVPLKKNVDDALRGETSIKRVIVFRRAGNDMHIEEGRDVWWHRELEYVDAQLPARGRSTASIRFTFSTPAARPENQKEFCTPPAVIWSAFTRRANTSSICATTTSIGARPMSAGSPATAMSFTVRSPNGATTLMYEGAPNWPEPDRFWQIIEEYGVNILYTAPTAIRAFIRWGDQWVKKHDLSSLRLLGTVGEPINPEAWMWYHEKIGGGRCPIVDTWWQTETGAIMITPLPGAIPTKPGSATLPFFGVDAAVVDEQGKEVGPNVGGKLIIRRPVAVHAAHDLRRQGALQETILERVSKAAISPATARAATRTAISGSWAGSTTC